MGGWDMHMHTERIRGGMHQGEVTTVHTHGHNDTMQA